jgi:hypothetical protein
LSHFLPLQESISPTFGWRNCANILAQIKSLTFTASTKKLRTKLLYEKGVRKMLVKLTPKREREKSKKIQTKSPIMFGSSGVQI